MPVNDDVRFNNKGEGMSMEIQVRWLLVLILFSASSPSWAILVSPSGPVTENSHPFQGNPLIETHYQQIYNGNLFSSAVEINSITFFAWDENTKISEGVYEFRLSTTTASVNGLDTSNLSNNVGADVTTFSLNSLSGTIFPELTISGNSFIYNPGDGNLLLEILVGPIGFSGGGFGGFQAGNGNFGDLTSRASNWVSGFNSYGLVTQFDVTPVPVPGALLLFISGMCILFGRGRI